MQSWRNPVCSNPVCSNTTATLVTIVLQIYMANATGTPIPADF